MASIPRYAFGLGIVLSTLGWLSAGFAQEQPASCQAIRSASVGTRALSSVGPLATA